MPEIQQDEVFDYYQEVARSAFADMLHDYERNRKYAIGLKKSIELMKSKGMKANVLDIGTGTGLLAMLASKYGADTVVSLEAFSPVSFVARKVIEENGFQDKIKIINKHSTFVEIGLGKDMEQKANILVAEVFDTELIGEGAIKTYNHALENLMEKDCLAIPESATVFVQLAECDSTTLWNTFQETKQIKCPENVSNIK
jgi:type III protein arginine methyltransferase